MTSGIVLSVLIVYVFVLTGFDLKTNRIPNWLSGLIAVLALLIQSLFFGISGIWEAVLGCFVGLTIFFPFYLLKGFGAGDVKAMAVIGMLLGPRSALIASMATLFSGSLIGLLYLLRNSDSMMQAWFRIIGVLFSLDALFVNKASNKKDSKLYNDNSGVSGLKFPYGISIAFGALFTLWYTS